MSTVKPSLDSERPFLTDLERTEAACRDQIQRARKEAEAIRARAQQQAAQLIEAARLESQRDEAKRLDDGIKAIDAEAARVRADGDARLQDLRIRLQSKVPDAVRTIVELVLPQT